MKYYQPEKEEFHIGFEFELYDDFDTLDEPKWHKLTYGDRVTDRGEMGCPFPVDSLVRVKCLDSDDIEECNFIQIDPDFFTLNRDGAYMLYLQTADDGRCIIGLLNKEDATDWNRLFVGTIKNKSELKRTLKQIGYESK